MDISHLKGITPKKVFLVALAVVIAFAIYVLANLSTQMLGINGSMGRVMLPEGAYAPGMDSVVSSEDTSVGLNANIVMMPPQPTPASAPALPSKIIRNADLALLVEDVDASVAVIDQIRSEFGGQVGSASVNDYLNYRAGDVTIWIPSQQFDAALLRVKKVGIRVTSERISSTDVSAQFVDLEARLKNLHATEAQYVAIMQRSGTIADVLSVTRELSLTRQSIEQLQGQMNYLSRQVALSSIHITLTQEIAEGVTTKEWRPLPLVKSAFRETMRDLTKFVDFLLVFLIKLPVLLIELSFWGALIYGIWRLVRVIYVRTIKSPLPTGGDGV